MTGRQEGRKEQCGWENREPTNSAALPAAPVILSALDADLGGADAPGRLSAGSAPGWAAGPGGPVPWPVLGPACSAVLGVGWVSLPLRFPRPPPPFPRTSVWAAPPPRPRPRVSKSTPSCEALSSVPFPPPPGSLGWQVPLWLAGGQAVTSSRFVGGRGGTSHPSLPRSPGQAGAGDPKAELRWELGS